MTRGFGDLGLNQTQIGQVQMRVIKWYAASLLASFVATSLIAVLLEAEPDVRFVGGVFVLHALVFFCLLKEPTRDELADKIFGQDRDD